MSAKRGLIYVVIGTGACFALCALLFMNWTHIWAMLFGDIVFEHCVWGVTVEGWLDANRNGTWDADEEPMAGLQYVLEREDGAELALTSDADGILKHAFSIECEKPQELLFTIYPRLPEDMILTTRFKSYTVSLAVPVEESLQFGFAFEGEYIATPAP